MVGAKRDAPPVRSSDIDSMSEADWRVLTSIQLASDRGLTEAFNEV